MNSGTALWVSHFSLALYETLKEKITTTKKSPHTAPRGLATARDEQV